jgi:hypothetical protein
VNETFDVAVAGTRRPEFIWRVQPQQRCQLNLPGLCVTTVVDKDWGLWKLHYVDIATPSLLQSNEVWSTRSVSDNICDTSDQLFLWRIQQLLLLWRNLGCKRRSEDCLLQRQPRSNKREFIKLGTVTLQDSFNRIEWMECCSCFLESCRIILWFCSLIGFNFDFNWKMHNKIIILAVINSVDCF